MGQVRRLVHKSSKSDDESIGKELDDMCVFFEAIYLKLLNAEVTDEIATVQYELAILYDEKEIARKAKKKGGKDYLFFLDKYYEIAKYGTVRMCLDILERTPIHIYSFALTELWRGLCDNKKTLKRIEIDELLDCFRWRSNLYARNLDVPITELVKKHDYLYEGCDYDSDDEEIEDNPESRELIYRIERDNYIPPLPVRNDTIYGPEIDFILMYKLDKFTSCNMSQDRSYVKGKYIDDYISIARDLRSNMNGDEFSIDRDEDTYIENVFKYLPDRIAKDTLIKSEGLERVVKR